MDTDIKNYQRIQSIVAWSQEEGQEYALQSQLSLILKLFRRYRERISKYEAPGKVPLNHQVCAYV